MCGICGIVKLNTKISPQDLQGIQLMTEQMEHRGPDDVGIFHNDRVILGHRRLSIIDLSSAGHQPMSNDDEDIWIIYNGEVYNFPELKKELHTLGYRFKSKTDTEVVLKAYEKWGEDAFEKLNGMFAFCIYDKRKRLLYLVRDHAGIKPLYYSFVTNPKNACLLFASQVKAFKIFTKDWEENPDWRIYFLIFGHIPEPYTTLKDVYMLPKGHYLKLNLKTRDYEIKRFIDIDFTERINDEREAIELVRNKFPKAVERHLISDAPIGVFLSGGIDSSLITLLAGTIGVGTSVPSSQLKTLSVIFNEKDYSEQTYQNIILSHLRSFAASCLRPSASSHHSYLVTEKDFIDNLDDIFLAMDQPTTDGVNTYFISKCAKEATLKTVLSGLGGDELFGGYPSFQHPLSVIANLCRRQRRGNLNPFFSAFKLFGYITHNKLKKLSFLSLPSPLSYYLLFRSIFTIRETSQLLDVSEKEIFDKLCHFNPLSSILYPLSLVFYHAGSCASSICDHLPGKNFVFSLETNYYMQNQLLKDTDFMSMHHSVEVRVPFLDKEFIKLVCSISENIKFNGKVPKFLLIKSFGDILPEQIINRPKQGFTFPFQIWMRNHLQTLVCYIPNRSNNKFITQIIKRFAENRLHWSHIWSLIVLFCSAFNS